jgi:hypothetical protein
MSGKNLKGLLALNGVALGLLAAVALSPAADAQFNNRIRGNYTMVSGRSQGSLPYLVYIANETSREIVAVRYNVQQNTFEGMGYADLAKDAGTVRQAGK